MIILKIIYGILLIAGGLGMIKYRKVIKSWTGNFYWAEHYIGRGGTYLIIILIGLAMIFMGAMYPFGGMDNFFNKTNQQINENK
ncbi:hypothetical protein LRZ95_00020 [Candidatus Gracilibacteria bacterium]|nr:hypothetical protein [Candidatus Gracilibacteria bacterium]